MYPELLCLVEIWAEKKGIKPSPLKEEKKRYSLIQIGQGEGLAVEEGVQEEWE